MSCPCSTCDAPGIPSPKGNLVIICHPLILCRAARCVSRTLYLSFREPRQVRGGGTNLVPSLKSFDHIDHHASLARQNNQTDSTIAPPPQTSDFCQRTFHGCSTQARILLKTTYTSKEYSQLFGCKDLTIDDVRVSRDTGFQEVRLGAGFQTGGIVYEKLRGPP